MTCLLLEASAIAPQYVRLGLELLLLYLVILVEITTRCRPQNAINFIKKSYL